ncbi:hypothetical protein [Pengzhenrongella sp.]|jgi:hypothetical protein|uniref:hypothetical protein n=1 Tax=Pengzhenrongella sp. TaxID=2888820 RepID=UPI002F92341B
MTTLRVTRSDVHAGDDPTPMTLTYAEGSTIGVVVVQLLDALPDFLPSVNASWVGWVINAHTPEASRPVSLVAVSLSYERRLVVSPLNERLLGWTPEQLASLMGGITLSLHVAYMTTSSLTVGDFRDRWATS